MVEYEKALFGINSVKIIQTNIGLIPDVYENEVRTMIFVKNGNCIIDNSLGLQNVTFNSNDSISTNEISRINNPKKSDNKNLYHASNEKSSIGDQDVDNKLKKSHYTTTYRSSYVKP